LVEIDGLVEAGPLLQNFAGAFLVGPEIGIADDGLKLIELTLLPFRVKGTSERPRCGILPGCRGR
jgi:hypothetical protein